MMQYLHRKPPAVLLSEMLPKFAIPKTCPSESARTLFASGCRFEDCLLDSRRAIAAQDDCKAAHQAYVAALQTLERFEECEAHLKVRRP